MRQGRNAHEIGELHPPGGAWTTFGRLAGAGFISRTGVAHFQVIRADLPYGEDIAAFLKREIAKPIIRWEDSPQLGYEILPNKYFYRYQPPTPAKDLLARFWELEKEAEKMLEGLAK